jgi:hypothetical protein
MPEEEVVQQRQKEIKVMHDVITRYPRLTAHLICESLGYFTPESAATAILHYIRKKPYFCEWYSHMAQGYDDQKVLEVGVNTLTRTFKRRKYHKGYMAEYTYAKKLVDHVVAGGKGPEFASWF